MTGKPVLALRDTFVDGPCPNPRRKRSVTVSLESAMRITRDRLHLFVQVIGKVNRRAHSAIFI